MKTYFTYMGWVVTLGTMILAAFCLFETSDEIGDIRMTAAEGSRVHFVEFVRRAQVTDPAPPQAPPPLSLTNAGAGAAVARQNPVPRPNTSSVRVIVIDPGHGGTDIGATTTGALEKDLTLTIARKLRATLQSQLGATVLLTRDSDVPFTSEARTSVANNNKADLFVSLHIGYSANHADLGSSVFVIPDNFAANLAPEEKGTRLFLPWYLGYRTNRPASLQIAGLLNEELDKALPGWGFPVRSGPAAVLTSATMPAVLLEVGNLNNPASVQALLDNVFQTKFTVTVAAAIERYAATRPVAK